MSPRFVGALRFARVLFTLLFLVQFNTSLAKNSISDSQKTKRFYFTENKGQWNEQVLYKVNGSGGLVWFLERDGITLVATSTQKKNVDNSSTIVGQPNFGEFSLTGQSFKIKFIDSSVSLKNGKITSSAQFIKTSEKVDYYHNYIIGNDPGNWTQRCSNYKSVKYLNVWDGIDIIWYEHEGNLEFDFVVQPAADVTKICMEIQGLDSALDISEEDNSLIIPTFLGELKTVIPEVYQLDEHGRKNKIEAGFSLQSQNRFSINISSDYRSDQELIIDPLIFSTYVGGTGLDRLNDIIEDQDGNLILAGATTSIDYPVVNGVIDEHSGSYDVVISKFTDDGSSLLYSTYIGGSMYESGAKIQQDDNGDLWIAGSTQSSDFPVTTGVISNTFSGVSDIYVLKLSSDGTTILASTFLGGDEDDSFCDFALDTNEDIYLSCATASTDLATANAFDETYNGNYDALAMKISNDLTSIIFSTYLGGSAVDEKTSLICEADNCVTVSGHTTSSDFPTTAGAYDETYNGGNQGYGGDLFITRLSQDGSSLVWSTYLGGTGYEMSAGGIRPNGSGGVIISGNTLWSDFPTTTGAYQTAPTGDWDIFITSMNSNGDDLIYSTLIGGNTLDVEANFAVDQNYNVVIVGSTMSGDYPVSLDAYDTSFNGGVYDMILSKLNNDGSELLYSTYFGGSGDNDGPSGLMLKDDTRIIVSGSTSSIDFPITAGAYCTTHNGGTDDAFIASFSTAGSFALLLPADNYISNQTDINMIWESVIPGQTNSDVNYEVFVKENDGTFISVVSGLNDTTYIFNAITDDQNWQWFVKANNQVTQDYWYSDTLSFTTAIPEPPAEFSLLSPANGEQVVSNTPTLVWEEAVDPDPDDIVTYTLYWSIDNIYFVDADSVTGLTEATYTFPDDLLLTGNGGNINFENINNQRISVLPSKRKKQSSGKSSYHSNSDLSLLNPGSNQNLVSELDDLPDNVTVYWKVRAVDQNTTGRWCTPTEGWAFETVDGESFVSISAVINASSGGVFTDNGNKAALNISATDEYDSYYDIPEPPAPTTSFLSLYFPHEEWEAPADNFMEDVRDGNDDLTNDTKVFQFTSSTDQTDETVDLTFEIGSGYPENYGAVLKDPAAQTYQNLREDLTYSFAASTQERNMELILGDATNPVLSFTSPISDELWDINTVNTVSWEVTDVSAIRNITLYYSCDDGNTWTSIYEISDQYVAPTSYQWATPDTFSTYTKLKLFATDWAGNSTEYSMPYTFNIASHTVSANMTSSWNMISLPLHPDDERVPMIFDDDDLGAYFVYKYSQQAGYTIEDSAFYTKGYWLFHENESVVDVSGIPEVDSSYQSLSTGWNIAAASFPAAFPTDSLRIRYLDDIVYLSAAVDSGWILPALYGYNTENHGYDLISEFIPWSGYWLFALQEDLYLVSYPEYPTIEPPLELDQIDDLVNQIPIALSMGDYTENLSCIGFSENATDGFDYKLDIATPPVPPTDYIRLTMDRSDWNAPVQYFSQDIRSELEVGESKTWSMIIEASQPGEITIEFPGIEDILPDDFSAYLQHQGENINLLENPALTIDWTAPYQISVTITNGEAAINNNWMNTIPTEYSIKNVYPNPFNPSLNIVVGLAEQGNLNLGIYNILGQKVYQLADDNLNAGYHTFVFHAEDLSSGIYFVRAAVPGKMDMIKKVVLTR